MKCIIRYKSVMDFLVRIIIASLSCVMALPAFTADAYRCKDANGKIVYSNVNLGAHCQKIDHPITIGTPEVTSERFDPPRSAQSSHRRGNVQNITITGRKENPAASSASGNRTRIVQDSPTQVGTQTQRTRDQKRLDILQEEVDIEMRNLAQAKANLAVFTLNRPASGTNNSADQLRQQIRQHEKNIVALKREIDRIR